jgi:hypothetical protein
MKSTSDMRSPKTGAPFWGTTARQGEAAVTHEMPGLHGPADGRDEGHEAPELVEVEVPVVPVVKVEVPVSLVELDELVVPPMPPVPAAPAPAVPPVPPAPAVPPLAVSTTTLPPQAPRVESKETAKPNRIVAQAMAGA